MDKKTVWRDESIRARIAEITEEIVALRREIHADPELGLEEHHTQDRIRRFLDLYGIQNRPSAGTGVYAEIVGTAPGAGKASRTVALRADIDALPIHEATGLEFSSKRPGVMHACGHDVHTSIQLGVARILNEMKPSFSGTVKLLFEPAEETVGGAKFMVEEGVLENPRVDAVIGLHVFPRLETGKIEFTYGKMNASTDSIHIRIEGVAGHGAYPHDSKDAIVAAGYVLTALQSIVARSIDPVESAVVTIGEIHGGTKSNVIADEVLMHGTLRTLNPEVRRFTKERIREVVSSTCEALGVRGSVDFDEGYPALVNDDRIVRALEHVARTEFAPENIVVAPRPSLGAESFAFLIAETPGAFYNLGCGNKELGYVYKAHHPKFAVDEACIPVGIEMQLRGALYLLDPGD